MTNQPKEVTEEMKKEIKEWKTKDGDYIPFNKIKDEHLLNILKWIERRAKNGIEQYTYGYEGDDDFMTGDSWTIYGKEVKDYYDYSELKKEAKKRNLL